jgi:hypothetical protein
VGSDDRPHRDAAGPGRRAQDDVRAVRLARGGVPEGGRLHTAGGINGRRAGSQWAPPYRLDVTELLREGANEIRIEVYNTAINELAEGGRLPDMKPVVERYGQRTRLQDLDGLQPLPSGIL